MKFIFKFKFFKKLYIFFWFLAVINIFFSTDNINANNFSINNIEISTPFEINFDKNEIIDDGFIKAFDQLILSVVQTKDKDKLEFTPLNIIKGMVETFSINEEKFIDEIYYLSLSVSFNKKKIFNFLQRKNIFPSLPLTKQIFFIPIIFDESKDEVYIFSGNTLLKNWNLNNQKYHLLEYVLPTEDLEDLNLIKKNSKNLEEFDFGEVITKYNLEDYIISIFFIDNERIRVINKINFNNQTYLKNIKFQNLKLENNNHVFEIIGNLKDIYENYWKSENEINDSVKSSFFISIDNSNNSKISDFEKILTNVELINNFEINRFNNQHNIYKIIFNGSPDNFLKSMREKNYEFNTNNKIWVLK
tara:strand:- start:273 stop:1352 length:1080 start_codon:yes stop_codon:yes gene_type:complete